MGAHDSYLLLHLLPLLREAVLQRVRPGFPRPPDPPFKLLHQQGCISRGTDRIRLQRILPALNFSTSGQGGTV